MAPSNDIIELGYTEVTVQEYFNVMGTLPKSLLAYYAIEKRLIIGSVVYEYKKESESRYEYKNSRHYSLTVQKLKSLHKKLEDTYLAFREQCYAEKELTEAHWKRLKAGDFVFMPQEAFSRLPADAKEYAVRPWEVFVAKAAQDAGSY